MFLQTLLSSDGDDEGVGEGVGEAVCAWAPTPENRTPKRIMLKWPIDLLLLRMVMPPHVLFTDYQHHERSRFDAATRPPACSSWRCFEVFRRRQEDFLGLGIESQGLGARLRLHCAGIFIIVG